MRRAEVCTVTAVGFLIRGGALWTLDVSTSTFVDRTLGVEDEVVRLGDVISPKAGGLLIFTLGLVLGTGRAVVLREWEA